MTQPIQCSQLSFEPNMNHTGRKQLSLSSLWTEIVKAHSNLATIQSVISQQVICHHPSKAKPPL